INHSAFRRSEKAHIEVFGRSGKLVRLVQRRSAIGLPAMCCPPVSPVWTKIFLVCILLLTYGSPPNQHRPLHCSTMMGIAAVPACGGLPVGVL
ncbi:hypothetical protein, partial [Paracoccus sp. (in: a-proteobacteria)]|uniref:hypothetical protein n=1 Tax=Paracoccus sp. TaxID=267 RepID=UPI00396CBAA9